jgi:arylsulfatase A-like enzyme
LESSGHNHSNEFLHVRSTSPARPPGHIPFIGTSYWRNECSAGRSCKPGNYSDVQLDFFACLNELDAAVGRVLDTLERQDYRENTMLWLTTDNGPEGNCAPEGRCTPDHFRTWPGSAGPLRGRKRDIWEGGVYIRV